VTSTASTTQHGIGQLEQRLGADRAVLMISDTPYHPRKGDNWFSLHRPDRDQAPTAPADADDCQPEQTDHNRQTTLEVKRQA
jgi:hypothetical protein